MMSHLRSAMERSRERARNRRTYRALRQLEEHYLRDIGLTRDDIEGMLSGPRPD
jgi:uncharacterized protein YjiS (DUF1127 family)